MPNASAMGGMNRQDLLLLALLTVFWGLNWPLLKTAVADFPPLAFRAGSMFLGLVFVGGYMLIRAEGFGVAKNERLSVILLSIPNMTFFHFLMILALQGISSGRAAILAYTMPAWTALSSVLFFRHRPKPFQLVSVGLALSATLLLSASEFSNLTGSPLSVFMMLCAAAGWGLGTVMIRQARLGISNACLLFWMLTFSAFVIGIASLLFELPRYRWPNALEWFAMLYNALIVFAFCHIVWFRLARKLQPIVSSLAVMLIPPIGVFSGAIAIGEPIGPYDLTALALILISMAVVLLLPSR
jgi:drug/metabolite transporter (DMT)-like permease